MKNSIAVFFPAYNDEATVELMVERFREVLSKLSSDYEIFIVNDGSKDGTAGIADMMAKKYKEVHVIHHRKNTGYGGALKTGFSACKATGKDFIFYTDGDAQYDVRELALLWPHINDYDVVNGYFKKRADSFDRIFFGELYHFFVSLLFRINMHNVDADFRLFHSKVFDKICLTADSGVICVEMMSKIRISGFTIKEIPVNHYPRLSGKSQFFRIKKILKTFRDLAKLWIGMFMLHKI